VAQGQSTTLRMLNRGATMNSAAPYLKLVGRVLLSIMFIQSGVGKIFG
jgi:uncharacterized membrane protein YphA (DoxX/SURF4 family)